MQLAPSETGHRDQSRMAKHKEHTMNSTRQLLAVAVSLALSTTAAAQTGASPAAGESARGTASPAVTAPTGGGTSAASAAVATHEMKVIRLSKLDGLNVHDAEAKKIGEVKDVVIDPASGRVLHALVSVGGLLGVGAKEFAVPTRELRVFSQSAEDSLPMRAQLGAPLDRLTPAKDLEKDSPYVMGSKLIGMDVNDSNGKDAGEIEDVIVDLQSGEARYALVEFDASWSVKDKLFAFRMSDLKRDKEGKDLALNVTRESLEQTPSIEKSRLDKLDLSDQSWLQAAGGASTPAAGGSAPAAPGGSTPAAGSTSGASPASK